MTETHRDLAAASAVVRQYCTAWLNAKDITPWVWPRLVVGVWDVCGRKVFNGPSEFGKWMAANRPSQIVVRGITATPTYQGTLGEACLYLWGADGACSEAAIAFTFAVHDSCLMLTGLTIQVYAHASTCSERVENDKENEKAKLVSEEEKEEEEEKKKVNKNVRNNATTPAASTTAPKETHSVSTSSANNKTDNAEREKPEAKQAPVYKRKQDNNNNNSGTGTNTIAAFVRMKKITNYKECTEEVVVKAIENALHHSVVSHSDVGIGSSGRYMIVHIQSQDDLKTLSSKPIDIPNCCTLLIDAYKPKHSRRTV